MHPYFQSNCAYITTWIDIRMNPVSMFKKALLFYSVYEPRITHGISKHMYPTASNTTVCLYWYSSGTLIHVSITFMSLEPSLCSKQDCPFFQERLYMLITDQFLLLPSKIVWILSLLHPCMKYALARWLKSPIVPIISSASHILYSASPNSYCMVSILLFHDALLLLTPCLLLKTRNAQFQVRNFRTKFVHEKAFRNKVTKRSFLIASTVIFGLKNLATHHFRRN